MSGGKFTHKSSHKSSLADIKAMLHSCKNMISRHLLTLTIPHFSTSYYSKYGPVEGANDRKSVSEFLKQSIVMCSSCRWVRKHNVMMLISWAFEILWFQCQSALHGVCRCRYGAVRVPVLGSAPWWPATSLLSPTFSSILFASSLERGTRYRKWAISCILQHIWRRSQELSCSSTTGSSEESTCRQSASAPQVCTHVNSYKSGLQQRPLFQMLVFCLTFLIQAAQALLLILTGKNCQQILHQQHQCCTNYPAPKQSDTRWFSQMSAQPPLLLFFGQIPFLHTKVEQTPPAHLHKFIKLLRIHLLLPPQVAGKQDTVKVLGRSRLRWRVIGTLDCV